MAINYNEEGMYLGYFETLGTLLSQYVGRRGNFAIVGHTVWVHDGDKWSATTADVTALNSAISANTSAINDLSTKVDELALAGVEMRWGYTNEIDATADEPEGWYPYALTADADNTIVYFSTRYRVGSGWSAWSTPTEFTRYIPKPKDGDGYQYIYYKSIYDDIADNLHMELTKVVSRPEFQNSDFVPENWQTNIPQPDKQGPFVYVSTRKQTNGVWGAYSKPVIAYTHIQGIDGKDGVSALRIVLSNERERVSCDKDGVPYSGTVSTWIYLYEGGRPLDSGVEYGYTSADYAKPSVGTNGYATITIDKDTPDFYKVFLTAKYAGVTYAIPWIIEKAKPVEDGVTPSVYRLASSTVAVNHDKYNSLTPQNINLSVFETTGKRQTILSESQLIASGYKLVFETHMGKSPEIEYSKTLSLSYGDLITDEHIAVKSEGYIDVAVKNNVLVSLVLGTDIVDSQTIIITHDGEDGADGEVDYTVVEALVKSSINNDKEWSEARSQIEAVYEWVGGEPTLIGHSSLSAYIDLTAQNIEANVSSTISGVFQEAGMIIESNGIKFYGDQIGFYPTRRSEDAIGLFDAEGFLDASLIKTVTNYYYGNNKDLKISVNQDRDGMIKTYWPVAADASNEAKSDPVVQLEIGWDARTKSVMRFYDENGKLTQILKMDGVISPPKEEEYEDPYPGFTVKSYCDITSATLISKVYPFTEYGFDASGKRYEKHYNASAYYEHNSTKKLYTLPKTDDRYLASGLFTPPGDYDRRPIYQYAYGVKLSTRYVWFTTPDRIPVTGLDIINPIIPTTDD